MPTAQTKLRAPRNRTIVVTAEEKPALERRLLRLNTPVGVKDITDKIICKDIFESAALLPSAFVDVLFIDPPYNLRKQYNSDVFPERSDGDYCAWFESWFEPLLHTLKPSASIYICCDWRTSTLVHAIAEKYLIVRNRITWEREKGRGAQNNWKNCAEDIWFCTVSDDYAFNVDAVKIVRKVLATYTDDSGKPKDWDRTSTGNFRRTYPSNIWTDLSVPFWSMPENTDHPTQKPEKLLAKIILASSAPGQIIFDPFVGSGTTAVTAKKLGRKFVGIERDEYYCCLAEKRLQMAEYDASIQGYVNGEFLERNTKK